MNYEAFTHLSDEKFKRLIGVKREVFNNMLACLEQAQASIHQRGGRKLKIGMPNLLMATLQYFKEYRTYEQIAADFGIHESTLIRKSHWIEDTLSKQGFAIVAQTPTKDDIAIVDVSEVRVNRSKKTKH
ncbi:transposase family protein [Moraxella bovis]|uniref:helix-turn-helix domain-containing protein n=1 Tax=Moraxella bovis TaxID=476 RepID=UPI002226008B|nr:transposase family protein [Moraxella bovis]UYZ71254.1 transposase family protein [Moraxella bovis]UYZ72832.1 transposase family protein [Moraxella bovis]UYZ89886.1 transposase family protein [Moraxella bovis]UZA14548.1 transposase family protein [Moraxella bovis]UZA38378.1 transposase family protein [Moraxella bovis]